MARGSRFSSTLNWFRTGDLDEVRAIMPLVQEAVAARVGEGEPTSTKATHTTGKDRSASARKAWRTRRARASRLNAGDDAGAVTTAQV